MNETKGGRLLLVKIVLSDPSFGSRYKLPCRDARRGECLERSHNRFANHRREEYDSRR